MVLRDMGYLQNFDFTIDVVTREGVSSAPFSQLWHDVGFNLAEFLIRRCDEHHTRPFCKRTVAIQSGMATVE